MRLQEDIDFTTLNWVKGELDETLKLARHALEAYIADPSDVSQMRFCATYLHQVQGTLRMVELYGAALVTEEMEQLAAAVQEHQVSAPEVAYEVLMDGIVQLPDYLERLQSGQKDIPVVLLPLLNRLRASRGEAELTESALFAPDITCALPLSAAGPSVALPDLELQQLAKVARGQFQVALLRWFKGVDAAGNLKRLIEVCDRLVSVVSQEEGRRLFWIAGGVLSGVESGGIPMDAGLKQVVGRVEREIKHLSEAGDTGFRVDPPRELTRNLLYFAAHAAPDNARTTELKEVYGLVALIPSKEEVESAEKGRGVNDSLIFTVAGNIKEDLLRVKDALDLFLRRTDRQVSELAPQLPVLETLVDTLSMLGAGVAQRIIQDQHDVLASIVRGDRVADESLMLDIAGALLHAESLLDDRSLQNAVRGNPQDSDSAVPIGEQRKVMEAVLKEAQANFGQAKQCFVAFVESNWDHAQLGDVPRLISEVMGAMRMLEVPLAADLLDAVARFTDQELLRMRRVPNGQQMDTLADSLAGLEYFLEALREHRAGREKILAGVQRSLESLGYWPLRASDLMSESDGFDLTLEDSSSDALPALDVVGEADDSADVDGRVAESSPPDEFIAPASTDVVAEPGLPAATPKLVAGSVPSDTTAVRLGADLAGFQLGGEDIDEEIREVFVEEVQEEIDNLSQLLPAWVDNPDNLELVKPIRRVFHTLKGSGRLVGAATLGEFSWRVENMLNRVLDQTIAPSAEVRHLVQAALSVLPNLLGALRGETGLRADIEGIEAAADALAAGELRFYVEPTVAVRDPAMAAVQASVDAQDVALDAQDVDAPDTSVETDAVTEVADSEAGLVELVAEPLLSEGVSSSLDAEDGAPGTLQVSESVETELDPLDELESVQAVAELLPLPAEPEGALVDGDSPLSESELSLDPIELELSESVDSAALDNGVADLSVDFGPVDAESKQDEASSPEDLLAVEAHIDPDLFEILRPEVLGHLETIDAYVASCWLQPRHADDALLRAAHTINGAFAMTEVDTLVELTAPLEGYIKRLLGANAAPSEDGVGLIQSAADALRHYLVALADSSQMLPSYADLVAALCAARDQLPEPHAYLGEPESSAAESDGEDIEAASGAPIAVSADGELALSDLTEAPNDVVDSADISAISSFGELDFGTELEAHAALPESDAFAPAELHGFQVIETEGDGRAPFWEEAGSQLTAPEVPSSLTTDELIDAADAEIMLSALAAELGDEVGINRRADESLVDESPVDAGAVAVEEAVDDLAALFANADAMATPVDLETATGESMGDSEDNTSRWVNLDVAEQVPERGVEPVVDLEIEGWEDAVGEPDSETLSDATLDMSAVETVDAVETALEPVDVENAPESSVADLVPTPEHDAVAAARRFDIPAEMDVEGDLDTTDVDLDLLDVFMEEGVDILDHADGVLAQLRETPEQQAPVVSLQRDLHTLKGGARMAGLAPIGDLAHVMESLLEAVAHGSRDLGTFGIEVLERGFDRLHQMVARVGQRQAIQPPTYLLETVEYLLHGELPSFVDAHIEDGALEQVPSEEDSDSVVAVATSAGDRSAQDG
ncbi:MAG: Hpt domain-containing protein, partial [Lysobacteraceae bacterium]